MKHRITIKAVLLMTFLLFSIAGCGQDTPETPKATSSTTETNTTSSSQGATSVQYVPLIDNENGLSLQYPAGWVTHSASGAATVATSQAIIDAESLAEIGDEAFVVMIPGEIDVFNFQTAQNLTSNDIVRALETYKALLEKEGQAYQIIEPPQSYSRENQNLARMIVSSQEEQQPLITIMAVIMGEKYMVLVSASSHEDKAEEMRPIFDHIIDSIEVREPGSFSVDQ